MIVFVILGLGLILGWIVMPLFRSKPVMSKIDGRIADLNEAKYDSLKALKDLEFDRRIGKVGDEDYEHLRQQQEGEAVAIMRELESLISEDEDPLEAEIAQERRRLTEGRG